MFRYQPLPAYPAMRRSRATLEPFSVTRVSTGSRTIIRSGKSSVTFVTRMKMRKTSARVSRNEKAADRTLRSFPAERSVRSATADRSPFFIALLVLICRLYRVRVRVLNNFHIGEYDQPFVNHLIEHGQHTPYFLFRVNHRQHNRQVG